ncbi:hypothetical protein F4777DRAFT_553758 [Nemania sp. FL0916]|nr:hypothetical protein F4777DRAFT_553758 [Nemania sp. FL0916]
MSRMRKWLKRSNRDSSDASPPSSAIAAPDYPQGLDVVHDDPNATLDIVAVHGLNGHREKTWTTADGVNWLRDLLPKDLRGIRVLTWGYDANTHDAKRVSCQYLYDHALELVADLTRKRTLTQSINRPIIFIAHSLGGIVVKSALIHSDTARQGALFEHRSIKTSTYGIIYMGTPHQGGSSVHLGRILVNVASIFIPANDHILKHLERDSEWLQQQLSQYNPIAGDFITKFAYETYQTPTIPGHKLLVVPKASAVVPGQADAEPIAIHADHINMVKFIGATDMGYVKLSETLQIMANGAGEKIRSRWETEARVNKALLLDSSQARTRCHYIPVLRNKQFTGRATVLEELKRRLFIRRECRKIALVGLGGVGKTQVALELAHWAKENQPDYSVFWVPVVSDESFEQAYTELGKRLDIRINKNDGDPKELLRRHLESERAGKWLLILDNVDEMEILDKHGSVGKYLPQKENGLTLFTTRLRSVAEAAARNDVIEIPEMTPTEATSFFQKSLIDKSLLDDQSLRDELFKELTCLPLAIAQAAAYLNQTQLSVKKYLERLRRTEQSLVNIMSREFYNDAGYPKSRNAVATTWLVSFDQIRNTSGTTAELLFFLSCIERQNIPQSILPGSLEDVETATDLLCGYAFLVRQGDDVFNMHRLVHIAIRVWVQQQNAIKEAQSNTIQHLASIFPWGDKADRLLWRGYLPHALYALQGSEEYEGEQLFELLDRIGNCLFADRRFKESIVALEKSYRRKEQYLHEEDRSRLLSENKLANAYLRDRQTEKAIKILEHIVAVQKTLAPEDPYRLASEHGLGSAYLQARQIEKAIKIFEHITGIDMKGLAEDHPFRLASEHGLGAAYLNNGQIEQAIEIFKRVVVIRGKTLAKEDNDRLTSEHELGRAYLDSGQIEKGIEILEHVVVIRGKTLAKEDNDRLTSERVLARAYSLARESHQNAGV